MRKFGRRRKTMEFKGSFVALVTPFTDEGDIDTKKLLELVDWHIESGTQGIVPCGCTGEAATLTHSEQEAAIKSVVDHVDGRVPVVAGTGSNSTAEAVRLTTFAAEAGVDGALIITPYYNKPTPEGQFRHYKTIAEEAGIPIMLYNVPSRTGVCMTPETVARLCEVPNIVAIKEASGSMEQVSRILSLCSITVMSGDDSMTLPMLSAGAAGVVSVAANVMPAEMAKLVTSFLDGDLETARDTHYRLYPLFKALFLETNPIPVKTALEMMGKLNGKLRMPLCEMGPARADLEKTLKEVGVL
jgi:4-hydroxy-tetrahydrodipicolinate synthase